MSDEPNHLAIIGLARHGSAETVVGSLQRLEVQGKLELCEVAVLYKNARGRIRLAPSPLSGLERDHIVPLMVGLAVGSPLLGALADAATGSGATSTGPTRKALQGNLDQAMAVNNAALCARLQAIDLSALEAVVGPSPAVIDELQPRALKSYQFLATNERLANAAMAPLCEVDTGRPAGAVGTAV